MTERDSLTNEPQVIIKRLPPSPAPPGDRPTPRAGSLASDRLSHHARFLDRPRGHRLLARGVLSDHRLQDHEPKSLFHGLFDLREIERELARRLAPRIEQA